MRAEGAVAVIVAAGDSSMNLGTGFFLRPSGLLLTNLHVVEGTDLVGVKLPDSKDIFWARNARGFDSENDLAVLEMEATGVHTVTLGDSSKVRVGDSIVVVGNPQGLEQTVSNGLISGIRELDGRQLFQITAPISAGSSGGPVFNERGEVIGVVVASLETGQNLNFAVPINYAKPLSESAYVIPIAVLPKRQIEKNQGPSSEVPQSANTQKLPKRWRNTLSGDESEIRIDADYIYREAKAQEVTGPVKVELETHCEMKKNGSEWAGRCSHYISGYNSYSKSIETCSWVTQEVITSVTATRIEGRSQNAPAPEGSGCPTTGVGWHDFAMIPSD